MADSTTHNENYYVERYFLNEQHLMAIAEKPWIVS